jgi:hypothetical protein
VPWSLRFPYDTVDARVFVRQSISELRRDLAVTDVQFLPNLPRSAWFDTVQVEVEFLEGHDQPTDTALVERLRGYLPQPPRNSSMLENFQHIYGPRQDTPNENGDHFPPDVRQQIINEYLGSAQSRSRLAASVVAPLRRNIDYQGIGRRTFLVEQMPEGALPVYDRDPEPGAMVNIHIGTQDPADFVLPEWVQPGAFAQFNGSQVSTYDSSHGGIGRVVEIMEVLRPSDPPGRNGPTYVKIQTWRVAPPEGVDVIPAVAFANLWEPVERPADPRPHWERLLGDDLF